MPPIPTKVLEKIQRREYINLSTLLDGASYETSNVTICHDGQLLVLETSDRAKSKRSITNITMWLQAYTRFTTALVAADIYNTIGLGPRGSFSPPIGVI